MRISLSVKNLYEKNVSQYEVLKDFFDSWVDGVKDKKWHYESRVKQIESFALKFETGRFDKNSIFDDFFAGMIVVTSHSEIIGVEKILRENFELVSKKPNSSSFSAYSPEHFVFDDLRIYFRFNKDKFMSPKVEGLDGFIFEIQIKTYLQHAWSISTHDLVYKSENISWAKHRVAYQVKAMLENIEISISSVEDISQNKLIDKESKQFKSLERLVKLVNDKWTQDSLPKDKKRLAENILMFISSLNMSIVELRELIDESKCNELLSISPFQAIIQAVIVLRWDKVLGMDVPKGGVFICQEVQENIPRERLLALNEMGAVITL